MSLSDSLTTGEFVSPAQRDRHERILGVAMQLASEGGFEAVQMREVADRADVALGTLYRYFPSKVHLLVSALAHRFEHTQLLVTQRPPEGATTSERVLNVLKKATQGMQADPNLAEALTRAFIVADESVNDGIAQVGMQLTAMLTSAIRGEAYNSATVPTDEEKTISRIISDVWLSALMAWVTGRFNAAQVVQHIEASVRLLFD